MSRLGEDVSEQLDDLPGYFLVLRHVRAKQVCCSCAQIVRALDPTRPIEGGGGGAPMFLLSGLGSDWVVEGPVVRQHGEHDVSGRASHLDGVLYLRPRDVDRDQLCGCH